MALLDIPIFGLAIGAFPGLLIWWLGLMFYRVYLHKLADFPGPRFAAASYLYEWYYDLWLGGQFTWKLKDLHDRYGPVVRVNPDELHFNDPDFYDHIFNNSNGRTEKPWRAANAFGPYAGAVSTMDHDLHRIRRTAVNPFFSRRSVAEIIPAVQPVVENLCNRLEEAAERGLVVNLKYAYAAFTTDAITEYCFSDCENQLLQPDFGKQALDDLDGFVEMSLYFIQNVHLPWLFTPLFNLPDWIARRLSPANANILNQRLRLSRQVEDIRSGRNTNHEKSSHKTIFHSLLQSDLPPQEKSADRLRDEAFEIVSGGTGTTSYVLKNTTYHIASNPHIHKKLLDSLKSVMPGRNDPPVLADLEKLPYLTAIINEGLRLTHAVTHRLMRSFPEKELVYDGKIIPPNTTVMMTSLLIHENEDIFSEPKVFRPERWLGKDQQRLHRYLTPFGRGIRACAGINLFWAEMYIVLGAVFRRFEFDISQVVQERDINVDRDTLLAATARDSPGVLVSVTKTS